MEIIFIIGLVLLGMVMGSFAGAQIWRLRARQLHDDYQRENSLAKKKKLTNTETALKGFLKQVDKSGNSLNDVLTKCIEKSWGGFEAEWYKKQTRSEEKIRVF